jgi:hypothetical protein
MGGTASGGARGAGAGEFDGNCVKKNRQPANLLILKSWTLNL